MIGALTGIVFFLVTACFIQNYRDDVRKTFTVYNPWFLSAGVFASFGQLAYFVALSYTTISKIALITSMEVFVTVFLTVVVFRSRENLTLEVFVAAGLGFAGTVLVILY
jgi:drug/metabolite transporter (DMT)-like permease